MAFHRVSVHWAHEIEPNPMSISLQEYRPGYAQLQSREENLIRKGGGVRRWNEYQTMELGLNLDHLKGDAYTEWMFGGHFVIVSNCRLSTGCIKPAFAGFLLGTPDDGGFACDTEGEMIDFSGRS